MKFWKLLILLAIFKTGNLFAQENLDTGRHLFKDKLTYILLMDENKFEYEKYHGWSPYTIEEKRKTKKSKSRVCGVIGYVSGAKGKGEYEIKNGYLILKFSEFKLYMDKKTDLEKETNSMKFKITDFIY